MEIIFPLFSALALGASLLASFASTFLAALAALAAPALLLGRSANSDPHATVAQGDRAHGPPGSVSRRLSRLGEREYKTVAIIGGGIAGVGCAYALSKHDNVQIHIFEKAVSEIIG